MSSVIFNAPMFRALLLARLKEFAGILTNGAAADIMMAVAAEVGLLLPEAHAPGPLIDRAPLAVLVVAETLRANAAQAASFTAQAASILDALAGYGFTYTSAPAPPAIHLFPKQRQALSLCSEGFTYRQIAAIMNTELSTVESHLVIVRRKLGARNTPHAVAIAVRLGLVDGDQARVPAPRMAIA